jgi:hypothetical protein
VLASSVIFALVHLDFAPLVLLNIALYALFVSFVAHRRARCGWVCGIHAGWNFFQGNVFGLPVSGIAEATSLFSFGPARSSSDALSGGAFGLEAGLIGTVVLVVATVVAFVLFRRTADSVANGSADQPSASSGERAPRAEQQRRTGLPGHAGCGYSSAARHSSRYSSATVRTARPIAENS